MLGFHIPAAPPLYTNTFLLISDAGHAVVIDPAAEVHSYDEILKQHNATLTTIRFACSMELLTRRRTDRLLPAVWICAKITNDMIVNISAPVIDSVPVR